MAALQCIGLINGKPCLYGDGLLGVVRASGVLEWIKEDADGAYAACVVKRRGEASRIERTFSEADAKLAGLWGKRGKKGEPTPWITYPQRMLAMRARAFALRDAFADVLKGIAPREEVEDWNGGNGRPPTVTPARRAEKPSRAASRTMARPSRRHGRAGQRTDERRTIQKPAGNLDPRPVTAICRWQDGRARILSDAELVAELEAGRDDGGTVEWHEEEPPTEATAEDVLDVSTLLARVEHAYSECHNLTRLHQVKDTLVHAGDGARIPPRSRRADENVAAPLQPHRTAQLEERSHDAYPAEVGAVPVAAWRLCVASW